MSNRAVAAGVFRAWAVMWSVNVLVAMPQFLNQLLRHNKAWTDQAMANYVLSSQTIAIGCEIVVVVFLFRKAEWLASLVFPVEQEAGLSFDAADLRSVLFSVVGIYFLLDGARHAVGSAYQLVTRSRGDISGASSYLWERDPENLARAVGGIAAGAFLLIGPRRFRDFLKRYLGRAPESDAARESADEG